MKRILVAGAAGFIGSHLCEALLKKNYSVIGVDSFVTGQKKNISHIESLSSAKNFQFIQSDICAPLKIDGPIEEIYNLASPASPRDFNRMPIFILRTCSQGHEQLLELACQKEARIMLCSTSEVYGDALVSPQPETYFGNVNPTGARSPYDEGKRYAEALTMAYVKTFNVNACIARIFNTYGPQMSLNDGRVISNFCRQILKNEKLFVYGDGSQTRSFCYIDDLIKGLILFMESPHREIINIGSESEITINALIKTFSEIVGRKLNIEYQDLPENDPKQRRPDTAKVRKLLSWQPTISLEEGLKKTLSYFEPIV